MCLSESAKFQRATLEVLGGHSRSAARFGPAKTCPFRHDRDKKAPLVSTTKRPRLRPALPVPKTETCQCSIVFCELPGYRHFVCQESDSYYILHSMYIVVLGVLGFVIWPDRVVSGEVSSEQCCKLSRHLHCSSVFLISAQRDAAKCT